MRPFLPALALAFTSPLVVSACSGGGAPLGPRGNLTVTTAPLDLEGVENACYALRVKNGTGQTVWQEGGLCADRFGDEKSDISYVGTCDASPGNAQNTVELTLEGLYDADGVALTDFVNPAPAGSPIIRTVTCVENADARVPFDLVVARRAGQGFVDVTVDFADVFCSAKLDCQDESGADLRLVPDPATPGARLPSAVLALACTGGPEALTHLYWSDIQITCGATTTRVPLSVPAGLMWDPPSLPAPAPLAQGMIFRGLESLTDASGASLAKAYFNVALGLALPAAGPCSISAMATVSDEALDACTTPADTVYPVIRVDAPLINGAGNDLACTRHGLDQTPGSGVYTSYMIDGPATFATEAYAEGGDLVVAPCTPPALVLTGSDRVLGETGADTATITLRLTHAPSAAVTVPLAVAPSGRTTPVGPIVLDAGNWSTGVTLNLSGVDDGVDGADLALTLTAGPATSTDARYAGLGATLGLTLVQDGPYCGDGVVGGDEDCDGDTVDCGDLSIGDYDDGVATCSASCTWDVSACTRCGDGAAQGDEDCDGTDLRGQSCTTLGSGYVGGTLSCAACVYDESDCESSICGNLAVESGEQCDPPATPSCGYGLTCQACSASCQTTTVQGEFCGDGIANGPEACDGADVPTCAELNAAAPYGTVTCNGSCQTVVSCSADPCAGQPTVFNGNVTLDGSAAPAGVSHPECITTINGAVTVQGTFSGAPTVQFPRLRAIVKASPTALTITAWPSGYALFPALEAVNSITISGAGVNGATVLLPALIDGSTTAGLQGITPLTFINTSGVTLDAPALRSAVLSVQATASNIHLDLESGADMILAINGSTTITVPATVTSFNSLSINAAATFTATGVTTVPGFFQCSGSGSLSGLTGLQSATSSLLACPTSLPNLTTVTSAGTLFWAPSVFQAPALATINAPTLQVFLSGNTTVQSLASFTGTLTLSEGTSGNLTFSALTTVGGVDFNGPNVTGPLSVGSALTGLFMPNLATVTGNFRVRGFPSLPQAHVDAILGHTTVGGTTTYCANQGGVACP